MHRVRQSLPYFEDFGWTPTVVTVAPEYVEGKKDPLLAASVPSHIRIIQVKAFSPQYTRKVGLGSLALRSLWFYWRRVNQLLKEEKFDLIYFSTTQFPVLILGNFWKKRFGIPYIIDMQDPWYSDYYWSRPKSERPPKFWFAYRLNKYLEPIAMRRVDAIIAVSAAYHQTLRERYPHIRADRCFTLTFGVFEKDMELAMQAPPTDLQLGTKEKSMVYIGRGGHDMQRALRVLFLAFKKGLESYPEQFSLFRFFFIGTSYAPDGRGKPTVLPVAKEFGVDRYMVEQTDRLPYFQAMRLLQDADGLVIPGSDDPQYTASKIYPYILAKRPILAVFHESSSVVEVLTSTRSGIVATFNEQTQEDQVAERLVKAWCESLEDTKRTANLNMAAFASYLADAKTAEQVKIFNLVTGL